MKVCVTGVCVTEVCVTLKNIINFFIMLVFKNSKKILFIVFFVLVFLFTFEITPNPNNLAGKSSFYTPEYESFEKNYSFSSILDPNITKRISIVSYEQQFHIPKLHFIVFISILLLIAIAILIWRIITIKRLNREIESEKSLLSTLIENIPDYIYVKDKKSKFVLANPSLINEMGATFLKEIMGKTDFDFYPRNIADTLFKDEQQIIKTGKPIIQKEEFLEFGNGEKKWISTTKVPLKDKRERIIGIVGIGRDITSYKILENILEEQRDRIKQYLDIVEVIIVVLDLEGHIQMINRKGCNLFGCKEEKLIGKNWFDLCSPDTTREKMKAIFENIKTDKNEFLSYYEAPFYCKSDEKDRVISWQFTTIKDSYGKITGILISGEDITQRIEAERALKKAEKQLQISQRMEAIGRLTSGIAHDFNNLLSVIIGYSDLLLLKYKDKSQITGEIKEIQKAANRAANLIHQLLIFSRKQILKPKVINLNKSIQDLEKILRRTIGENIKLTIDLNPDISNIMADPAQIEQILMNLVVNAKDAMKNGGILTIKTDNIYLDENYTKLHPDIKPGEYVMLEVSDTGIGMDEETRDHIFEPFFTTKKDGIGTGLGLSTVYGIVKQSGGSIYVYSESGKGTVFKIYLPVVHTQAELSKKEEKVITKGGKETILLVEDDDNVRSMVVSVLKSFGYEVIEAKNGVEALKTFEENKDKNISLIITDMIMPEMGGKRFAENIRRTEIGKNIKVLFISGYSETEISEKRLKLQNMYFLAKPFNADILAKKVREILDSDA